ncbi:MAG: TonB-dependent receptor plug domain-containing protein [Flammeovirgaceae bacterium]
MRELEEVVITATRNERTMGALPMPVTLVQTPMIKTMGSVRLNDVLTEQTGLVVVPQINGMGNGIQIQGFNPDYTLILVDGEPLIGRFTGSLELSRLTVGNIKQIEIVKGPSSSLYGSEALAGVINIITEKPTTNTARFSTRYATNNTLDLNATAGLVGKKWSASIFANRYSTDGYDLSPEVFGKTVSPFRNYTLGTRVTAKLSPKTEISVGGRYFTEQQDYNFDVAANGQSVRTYGNGHVNDWNLNPVVTHRFSEKFKAIARYYTTGYATNTDLRRQRDDSLTYQDNFNQRFTRYELNGEYFFNERHITTVGAGVVAESVITSRYDSGKQISQQTRYAFAQHEWNPVKPFTIIAGVRYDHNSIYGDQVSPKLSARYEVNPKVVLKASMGVGFKAPDFRQLYYNFYNVAGGGYILWGADILKSRIGEFERLGLLQPTRNDLSSFGKLEAERSISINVGVSTNLTDQLKFDLNLYRNFVNNFIDHQTVAVTTSKQQIISFKNLNKVFTQGLEADLSYQISSEFTASLGYQLLFAKDQSVVDSISLGKTFWRDPNTLQTQRLTQSEYFGLYNRSRHTGNFKIFYRSRSKGWEGSLRVVYRGKFGIGGDVQGNIQGQIIPSSDRNNNTILDVYDSFVPGYALVNLSVAKQIQQLRLQVGIDNLFDYTNPVFIPNLPGRLIYAIVSYSLFEKSKTK